MEYQDKSIKSLEDLEARLMGDSAPVLLLEGTRAVANKDESLLKSMGRMLAERFPSVVFRSGNAKGSDTLFARGVESVDRD